MDMEWDSVINPTSDKILRPPELIRAIPEVHWSSDRAGVGVATEIARKIEALWKRRLESVK
jgi:hypothetical protein